MENLTYPHSRLHSNVCPRCNEAHCEYVVQGDPMDDGKLFTELACKNCAAMALSLGLFVMPIETDETILL